MAIPTILSGAAGRALRTLTPLTTPTKGLDALVLVNRAMPDMASALGDDAAKALGKRLFDASRGGSTRTAGAREQVRLGLDELRSAASSTARTRLVVAGSLAVGGTLAGLLALRGAGQPDPVPMAPGPLGGHDASSDGLARA